MLRPHSIKYNTELFLLSQDPKVKPFVRHKVNSLDENEAYILYLLEEENKGNIISRVIFEENNNTIGMISLFDIEDKIGFLATWIGVDYHGKGYNAKAKEIFLKEIFMDYDIGKVMVKIRKINERSYRASKKLIYVTECNEDEEVHIRNTFDISDEFYLLQIQKQDFLDYMENYIVLNS